MIELALNNVVKYFGATEVLADITFEIQSGEKVGLIGRNGSGKSTILKLISGIEKQDKGAIMIKKGSSIGYLSQIPEYPEECTVNEVLNSAFKNIDLIETEMREAEKEMKNLKGDALQRVLRNYSMLQQKLEALGGYEREEKLSKVTTGLNFSEEFKEKPFQILSGGEKTTVVLGKILLQNPDILLLDEPTNHLDMNAIEWLENYLKEYKGVVVIVSHDRYFLDRVITKTIEVEDMVCESFKGNYSEYMKQKQENLLLQFEAYKEQQKKIKAMEKAIKDLRDWAIRADNNKFFRRAASMQKRLDKMTKIDRPKMEKDNIKLNFQDTKRSGKEVIKAENLYKSFDNKILFKNVNLLIRYEERVALIGPNGSGKSTFLKIMLGEINPDEGNVSLGSSINLGYLPQNVVFNDEEITVLECFRDGITIQEGKAREYLAKFMFFGNSVFKKVKNLSGGEKSRLKLARLLHDEINLLILDEPTNHLDIESIETLEEALASFQGTIFFISHDRYFINKLCDRVLALENWSFKSYEGNYDYYREKKIEETPQISESVCTKKQYNYSVKKDSTNKKLENEKIKLEKQIGELEEQIKDLNRKMNSLANEYESLQNYYEEKILLQKELDILIEQWIEIEDICS